MSILVSKFESLFSYWLYHDKLTFLPKYLFLLRPCMYQRQPPQTNKFVIHLNPPYPFAWTNPFLGVNQLSDHAEINILEVLCDIWFLPTSQVDSIITAVWTVSPKSWNCDLSPCNTLAATGRKGKPNLIDNSPVSGPNDISNSLLPCKFPNDNSMVIS